MYQCTLLLLMLAGVAVSSSKTDDKNLTQDSDAKMTDWFAKVEQRLTQLETENHQLRAKNHQLNAENTKLTERVSRLERKIVTLIDSPRTTSDTSANIQQKSPGAENLAKTHHLEARADDIGPLEPVVTQMAQRLTEVSAEIQTNTARIQTLQTAVQQAGSSAYVRWGKSTCPTSTSLVYSGIIGGSYFNHPGAAANVLCLTLSPVFSDHTIPGEHSELYGAEYETWDDHYQKDPVCAVCRSQRPTTIMVPGTNVCIPGWTVEYSGFLMANHISYAAGTDYICVDSAMEDRLGGDENTNGLLLHYTSAVCGSLPCSPYVNGKAVTCVVCSQ